MAHYNGCQHKAAQLFQTRDKGHGCCLNCLHEGCQVLSVACHCTSPSLPSKCDMLLVLCVLCIQVCGILLLMTKLFTPVK